MLNEALHPRQMFEFLLSAGVDMLVGEEAVNRFSAQEAAPPPPVITATMTRAGAAAPRGASSTPSPITARATPALPSPDEAIATARSRAQSAATLEALEAVMRDFEGCSLKSSASRLVFADGNPQARVMLIGEPPGREEDESGRPFFGKVGQLLDKMLAAIGLDRTQVYLANIVPWRPPGNRTPTPQELAICLPFMMRQIELCAPEIIVTMGAPASQTLLNQRDGILRLRGQWFEYEAGERRIPALATLHPAYLLRQTAHKALAWRDLRALQAKISALPPPPQ